MRWKPVSGASGFPGHRPHVDSRPDRGPGCKEGGRPLTVMALGVGSAGMKDMPDELLHAGSRCRLRRAAYVQADRIGSGVRANSAD